LKARISEYLQGISFNSPFLDNEIIYCAHQTTALDLALQNNCGVAVMLHSDGQHPPEFLLPILKPIPYGFSVLRTLIKYLSGKIQSQ